MEETDRRSKNGEIDLKWAIYYELEAFYNEPMDTVKADLNYLMERYVNKHDCYAHIDGKPVVFVYTRGSEDNTEEFMKKWADAVDDKWYYVLKVFGGYRDMNNQPSSWHQYGPSTRVHKHKDSSGKVLMQERNVSSMALDFEDRFVILNLEIGDKVYRLKYLNQ